MSDYASVPYDEPAIDDYPSTLMGVNVFPHSLVWNALHEPGKTFLMPKRYGFYDPDESEGWEAMDALYVEYEAYCSPKAENLPLGQRIPYLTVEVIVEDASGYNHTSRGIQLTETYSDEELVSTSAFPFLRDIRDELAEWVEAWAETYDVDILE